MARTATSSPGRGRDETRGKDRSDRAVIVRLTGDIDRQAAESCEWLLHNAGEDVRLVVVDLVEARSIDRNCIPLFVARSRKLKARGGSMAFAASAIPVRQVIRASTGELPVLNTVNEAIDFVEGRMELVGAGVRSGGLRRGTGLGGT